MTSKDVEPAGYAAMLAHLKTQVRAAQTQAMRAANVTLLELYWTIGSEIIASSTSKDGAPRSSNAWPGTCVLSSPRCAA